MNAETRKQDLVLLGAGGHARVVLEAARLSERFNLIGLIDRDDERRGEQVDGIEVLGGEGLFTGASRFAQAAFVVAIGGEPGTSARRDLYQRAIDAGLAPSAPIIHPSAVVSRSSRIGRGTVMLAGSVVQPGAVVGASVIVNSHAVVEHDCAVGDQSHIAPGAIVLGGVVVGESAHVGAGSVVLEGRTIGDGAVIGAGAVVLQDVPPGVTVVGVPARPIGSGPGI